MTDISEMSDRMNRLTFAAGIGLIIILSSLVSGCSNDPNKKYRERDVVTLYYDAVKYLDDKQYRYAAAAFDEVERQHPYSQWARRGQLMSAYSYYMANRYDEAVLATERFIALHPGNKDAAYAYYLTAISYYEQISDVGRDQKMTEQALSALQEVVRRFPNSEYAKDARLKIDLTRDHLAGKEMEIGRFYLNAKEYLSAALRFKNVIDKYQTTSHVPEAMHRLVETYMALGLTSEAQQVAAVLGYNYPQSDWYRYSYRLVAEKKLGPIDNSGSWFGRMWDTVF